MLRKLAHVKKQWSVNEFHARIVNEVQLLTPLSTRLVGARRAVTCPGAFVEAMQTHNDDRKDS